MQVCKSCVSLQAFPGAGPCGASEAQPRGPGRPYHQDDQLRHPLFLKPLGQGQMQSRRKSGRSGCKGPRTGRNSCRYDMRCHGHANKFGLFGMPAIQRCVITMLFGLKSSRMRCQVLMLEGQRQRLQAHNRGLGPGPAAQNLQRLPVPEVAPRRQCTTCTGTRACRSAPLQRLSQRRMLPAQVLSGRRTQCPAAQLCLGQVAHLSCMPDSLGARRGDRGAACLPCRQPRSSSSSSAAASRCSVQQCRIVAAMPTLPKQPTSRGPPPKPRQASPYASIPTAV